MTETIGRATVDETLFAMVEAEPAVILLVRVERTDDTA
jgi:hypothetical protein